MDGRKRTPRSCSFEKVIFFENYIGHLVNVKLGHHDKKSVMRHLLFRLITKI